MNEDEIVDDFMERHIDAIATHLLYLRVQEALRKRQKKKDVMFPIIDSIDLIGRPTGDYQVSSARIKSLMEIAKKCNVAIITSSQQPICRSNAV